MPVLPTNDGACDFIGEIIILPFQRNSPPGPCGDRTLFVAAILASISPHQALVRSILGAIGYNS